MNASSTEQHRSPLLSFLPVLAFVLFALPLSAQTSCKVAPESEPSAVQRLLNVKKYSSAIEMAQAASLSTEQDGTPEDAYVSAHAEYILSLLAAEQTLKALDQAHASLQRYPENALLFDLLGEIYFQRGEIEQALSAYENALKRDPCSGQTHYDVARYNQLNMQPLNAQKQLNIAHQLSPHDDRITGAWKDAKYATHSLPEKIHHVEQDLTRTDLSTQQIAALNQRLRYLQTYSKGSCQITQSVGTAVLPLVDVGLAMAYSGLSVGMEIALNNAKPVTLELDTGASGITISRQAAKSAGLTNEAETSSYGVGAGKNLKEELAHVEKIRIGNLEFHNCLVNIMQDDRLHQTGLIGADVFSSWLVTIDAKRHQLRLHSLPAIPGEATENKTLGSSGDESLEPTRNRYTPPEFRSWTPVYRDGHNLIFPTKINDKQERLFIMDTGAAAEGLIATRVADENTSIGEGHVTIQGISGTQSSSDAQDYTLTFARVREHYYHVPAVNLDRLKTDSGASISGLIGFSTLQKLVITIDYRDSLVHAVPAEKSKPDTI